jgi:hypothetical protein
MSVIGILLQLRTRVDSVASVRISHAKMRIARGVDSYENKTAAELNPQIPHLQSAY